MEDDYVLAHAPNGDGNRVMHITSCQVAPETDAADDLGTFEGCEEALQAAREQTDAVDGCALCCPECHTLSEAAKADD